MKVFLIRHAESAANAGAATSDPMSISITENGRMQAIRLANEFNDKPDLIIVSAYLRTIQTAAPLTRKFLRAKVETWPLHEFTYLSPAQCLNTTSLERLPLVKEYWDKCDPDFVHGAGAESFNQFSNRITECIERLRQLDNFCVVIFTHSLVMKLLKQCMTMEVSAATSMRHFRDKMLEFPIKNTEAFEMKLIKT